MAKVEYTQYMDYGIETAAGGIFPLQPVDDVRGDISKAKRDSHDKFSVLKDNGNFRSSSQVIGETLQKSRFYIGETPTGKRVVFGVIPEIRVSRNREVPTDVLLAHDFAEKLGMLKAINGAEHSGQITADDACEQASNVMTGYPGVREETGYGRGRVSPETAIGILREEGLRRSVLGRRPKESKFPTREPRSLVVQRGEVVAENVWQLPQETEAKAPKGSRRISNVVYATAGGLAMGSLILSACAPVTSESGVTSYPSSVPTDKAPQPTADNPKVEPTGAPVIPTDPVIENTETSTLPTPSPEIRPTPTPPDIARYPQNDSSFSPVIEDEFLGMPDAIRNQSYSAEIRIRELLNAAGQTEGNTDLDIIQTKIKEELARNGIDFDNGYEWIYSLNEQADMPGWTVMARNRNTMQILWPYIGEEQNENDQVEKIREISGGLFMYENREGNFFDLDPLANPPGLGEDGRDLQQSVLKDESGWFTVGVLSIHDGSLRAWYNAQDGNWYPASSFKPSGAASVNREGDGWVAYDSQGRVGWNFDAGRQEWVKTENEALINLKNELFRPDTTSELVSDNYAFTIRLSEGLLARSGLNYVNIPDDAMDKMFLQSMGRFMYFLRDFYPEKYSEFFPLAEEITTSETKVFEPDYTSFINLAKPNLEEGPIPVQFNNAPISGMISSMEMNLVSKDEFLNNVLPTLDSQGIVYSGKAPWVDPNLDSDIAAFIEGDKLVIYSYNLGLPEDRDNPYHKPLEIQGSGNRWSQLYGIMQSWKNATILTQINFSGHDYSTPLQSRFDLGSIFVTENGELICGPRESERTSWEKHCQEVTNQTFIPGYQP